MFGKIKKFIAETVSELKKVSWTTRQELLDATKVVLVSSLLLAVYIAVTDFTLAKIVGMVIR
jgi:preprotein translocase subunit SecE